MKKALAALIVLPLVSACSLGSQNLSLGYNDEAPSARSVRSAPLFSGGFAPKAQAAQPTESGTTETQATETGPRTRMAALDSRANQPSAKAPRGALADRDYSKTKLDPGVALAMINAYRKENGLRALTLDETLAQAATMHSRDLAKWDRISHYGSDGSNPWDRVKRVGFKARLAAENVGTGQKTMEEVFAGWQRSPGHNKNLLLADATHMGIALVDDPKTEFKTFWTLVLGAKL